MGCDAGRKGNLWSRGKGCSCCFTLLKRAPTAKHEILVGGKATEKLLLRIVCFSLHVPSRDQGVDEGAEFLLHKMKMPNQS